MTNAEVQYKKSGKIVSLSKQEINGMKKVFTRNVKPELQSDFIYDVRIDLFRDSTKLAYFLIYLGSEKPYANFYSDRLNFGFRLTYSIGMFLDESQ